MCNLYRKEIARKRFLLFSNTSRQEVYSRSFNQLEQQLTCCVACE